MSIILSNSENAYLLGSKDTLAALARGWWQQRWLHRPPWPSLAPWFCRSLRPLRAEREREDPGMPGLCSLDHLCRHKDPPWPSRLYNQFPSSQISQASQSGLVASRGLLFLAIPLNMSQCGQTRDWMTVDRLTLNFEKDSIIQFGFHKLHAVWEHDRQSETGPSQCHHWLAGSSDPEPQCG